MSLEERVNHHPLPCCSNNSSSGGSLIDPSIMSARTMHDNVNRINRGQKYDTGRFAHEPPNAVYAHRVKGPGART